MSVEKENQEPHPWGAFLNARWKVILWFREEYGYDDETIAERLSMDERQVYLIRTTARIPCPVVNYPYQVKESES